MAKFNVVTLSGQTIEVLDKNEQQFYEEAMSRYLSQNKFTESSDLRTLERLLGQELLCFRWQKELAQGFDQFGVAHVWVDVDRLRKSIKETLPGISDMQKDLGLTKSQRDKQAFESVGTYITELQVRAKEFGYHREKQLGKAMELINELFAHVGAFDRSNEEERKKIGFKTEKDLIKWIIEYMKPEYDKVDEYFQNNQQKHWLRKL